jgi:hypothetical protein
MDVLAHRLSTHQRDKKAPHATALADVPEHLATTDIYLPLK